MSHCTFTFSANTGGALLLGPARIWYDALHRRKVPGFSTISPTLLEEMRRCPDFAAPDVIFHSHCHPDHFSRTLPLPRSSAPKPKSFFRRPAFPDRSFWRRRKWQWIWERSTYAFAVCPMRGPNIPISPITAACCDTETTGCFSPGTAP